MKIGLIDSGIGGLTVLAKLLKVCPNHEYIYFGDTKNMPYGEKTKDEIINYGNKIIEFLESMDVDVIILACGTLSSNKEYLQSKKKIIDLISPLENKLNNYQSISIMATPLSVKTNAFQKYIKTNINLIACPKLVPLIEANDYSNMEEVLKEYLVKASNSDALILGCTHYPIVIDYIKKYFHKDILTLDEFILEDIKKLKESNSNLKIYFSKINEQIIKNTKKILNKDNIEIERKCLND